MLALPSHAFYTRNDICLLSVLRHKVVITILLPPYLCRCVCRRFREFKTFLKRVTKAIHRHEWDDAKRLWASDKPVR